MLVVCAYGAIIAYVYLSPSVYARLERWEKKNWIDPPGPGLVAGLMGKIRWMNMGLGFAIQMGGIRIAGVGLLASLTWPLPLGLLGYHVYLIWAGMTTNESSKWEDWKEDVYDGIVWMTERKQDEVRGRTRLRDGDQPLDPDCGEEWPVKSRQVLVRTTDGRPPQLIPPHLEGIVDRDSFRRCEKLAEVENIYDIGFIDNLADVLRG
jgi:palmitoyltransferase ZDHHC4